MYLRKLSAISPNFNGSNKVGVLKSVVLFTNLFHTSLHRLRIDAFSNDANQNKL
jgi:hypothetical protein